MKRVAFSSSSSLPALKLTQLTRLSSIDTPSIPHFSSPPATALALPRLSSHRHSILAGLAIHRISIRIHNSMSESEVKEAPAPVVLPDKEKKISPPPPNPPEQPEPGDCCGSGCVRCVWDVYYDELEEYNKLIEQISSSSPDPPVS